MNIFVDAVGGRLHRVGTLDVQLVAVGKESIGVEFCHLHHGFVLPGGALKHLVFAGVGIGRQVAHIGNVHHPLYGVAKVAQTFLQHILHDVGAQVADVGIVIHRGAAGIHPDQLGVSGNEQLLFVGKGIIKVHTRFLLWWPQRKNASYSLPCRIQEAGKPRFHSHLLLICSCPLPGAQARPFPSGFQPAAGILWGKGVRVSSRSMRIFQAILPFLLPQCQGPTGGIRENLS